MSARRFNLSAISPFGPIFGKELRVTARRKRSYFLRFFYLAFLLLFLIFVWSVSGSFSGGGAAYRQQRQAQLGEMFFATFAMFCVAAMGLVGPVLTATAVNAERLHRTLGVLLMTPINSWQIVSGKLFSRMLIALTLIGLSMPVLALVRLLGGVEIEQMFGVICLAAVTALAGASIGLLFSTIVRRGYAVILLSYALMLFIYMFVPMMIALADLNVPSRWIEQVIATFNPFFCTGMLAGGMPTRGGWEWQQCAIAHLAFSAILALTASLLLRRIARREGEGAAPSSGAADAPLPPPPPPLPLAGAVALPLPLPMPTLVDAPPAVPQVGNESSISDNPVLWRELRRPLMNRRWQRIAGTAACVVLLLITYGVLASEHDLLDEESHIGYAWVFNGLTMLLACVLAATAIAQEKEGDTWTLLLTTPMSGRQIIMGKVLGVARKMLWPTLLVAAHFLIFAAAGAISWGAAWLTLWIIVAFNAIWIATGVFLSLYIRRVTFAVVVNLMLPIILYAVVPIVLLIIGALVDHDDDWAEATLFYLPYYYQGFAIDGMTPKGSRYFYLPYFDRVDQSTFVTVAMVAGCAYLTLTGVIVSLTINAFDRIVGRAGSSNMTSPPLSAIPATAVFPASSEPLPDREHSQ